MHGCVSVSYFLSQEMLQNGEKSRRVCVIQTRQMYMKCSVQIVSTVYVCAKSLKQQLHFQGLAQSLQRVTNIGKVKRFTNFPCLSRILAEFFQELFTAKIKLLEFCVYYSEDFILASSLETDHCCFVLVQTSLGGFQKRFIGFTYPISVDVLMCFPETFFHALPSRTSINYSHVKHLPLGSTWIITKSLSLTNKSLGAIYATTPYKCNWHILISRPG